MRIIISVATSLDGFMADNSGRRLILSSPEDFNEVYRLRAESDAILVGGETVRADNPSLATRHPEYFELRKQRGVGPHPLKAVMTQSGNLPKGSRFFSDGDGEKLVYSGGRANPAAVIADLEARNIQQLMIEGGARTIQQFLQAGLFDLIRLAIAPVTCGTNGRAQPFPHPTPRLTLHKTETHGNTAVLWYYHDRH
jgi:5-amino-6-(5-phosphoribosylamino)uracil reductase